MKRSYIYCLPHFLLGEKSAPSLCVCKCEGYLLFFRNLVNYSK